MGANPVLGIDFGTSNTGAAWVDAKGLVRLMPVKDGVSTLPSAAWFDKKGTVLIGQAAKEMALTDPQATIYSWKRFLGRKFQSDFVYRQKDRFPYELCAGPDGLCAVKVHGEIRTLEEVTFQVINRVLELSQAAAGHPFEECVLTVPAHAGFKQRRALRAAAEMAGLEVTSMINEPTAAAFSVLLLHAQEGTFLVFDLGGGTLDCTLLSMWQGLVQVLAADGDLFLGGNDFDAKLVDAIVEQHLNEKRVDLRTDPIVMQRLSLAAEHAKIRLSSEDPARVTVRAISAPTKTGEIGFTNLDMPVSRAFLEQATASLVEKAVGIARNVIEKKTSAMGKLDGIIFVGGMTRMPLLRRRLHDVIPAPAVSGSDPDTAVCIGAAELGRGRHVVMDVVPMSIGMMVPGGISTEVVSPSSVVPCTRKMPIPRPAGPQPLVLAFYEAVSSTATEREMLGTAKADPGWLAHNPGELTLEIKLDKNLELSAVLRCRNGAMLQLPWTAAR
jgi:molecular chaperone DnaK